MSRRRADLWSMLAMALLCAMFALVLHRMHGDLVPRRNVFFNADTDRVMANLVDRHSNFTRLSVHPLFGLVSALFRLALSTGMSLPTAYAALSILSGGLFGALTFVAVRTWGGSRTIAAAAVVFAASCAGFVYWVAIPETHFLGGLTVLVVIILARHLPAEPMRRAIMSGTMIAAAAAMVVSNIAVWLIWFATTARRTGGRNGRVVQAVVQGGVGLGILSGLMIVQDLLLRNPSAGRLARMFHRSRNVALGDGRSWDQLNALAGLGRNVPLYWVADAAIVIATALACVRLRKGPVFIPVFALFGVLLHSVFDRAHAFLFAANYLPAAAVSLALMVDRGRQRLGAAALVAAAIPLAAINVSFYRTKLQAIAVQSDPVSWYDPLRLPHPVPSSDLVRPADPPIGADADEG